MGSTLPSTVPWLVELIDRFERAWQAGPRPVLGEILPTEPDRRREALLALVPIDLEYRWRIAGSHDSVSSSADETDRRGDLAGVPTRPLVDDYCHAFPELGPVDALPEELIAWEYRMRLRWGNPPSHDEYRRRFAQRGAELDEALASVDRELALEHAGEGSGIAAQPTVVPSTHAPRENPAPIATTDIWVAPGPSSPPGCFGRYQVTDLLGEGGYGVVYRGYDPELRRAVAIKVPRAEIVRTPADAAEIVRTPADAEAYLTEARVLAGLDHVGIVPVHDVGRSDDGFCYVVSKFIPGGDLAHLIADRRPAHDEAAEIMARVAEALHYAHQRGLVHRDVKPANILLDEAGRPLLADFGLVLSDQSFGEGSTYCGTPAYMSPEQARGEGHRVDARSDVYSLGVVFYELLAGRRPYRHEMPALLDEITNGEIRPPRQLDHTIPKELERICLKALAKRAGDRYTTAFDLADDLEHWSAKRRKRAKGTDERVQGAGRVDERKRGRGDEKTNPQSAIRDPQFVSDPLHTPRSELPARVVPKGLRSFDGDDADFFLQLLPGPTDRDGLPESIRFWKTRIERTDAEMTFSVGLIYGPSGCGKSSHVKAGLLPRLAAHVLPVYLEATSDDTEARLLRGLRKACGVGVPPALRSPLAGRAGADAPSAVGGALVETLASLRRGRGLASGQKVLIVVDQFEQWLHGHDDPGCTELVKALRHCDGSHVQSIVMVRDDFWMAASRFLRALEIPLVEGDNSAAADLFDRRHARRVLELFGRAYGCLGQAVGQAFQPDVAGHAGAGASASQAGKPDLPLSPEQEQFLDQAVAGLAEKEKVVSVRLALFAEMVKSKSWTPATLVEIGGIAGVGATFLEETFSVSTAPPRHRLHQQAARAVLKALLPEPGADIKGHRRGTDELFAASGYQRRPDEFTELLHILDAELRLVTPADEEEARSAERGVRSGEEPQSHDEVTAASAPHSAFRAPRSYQLTHDYLVPSLRDWLTRKQRETRGGRAELRLAERAAAYMAKRDARFLPSWWEWPNILLFTRRKKWTAPERRVMRAAGNYHGLRLTGLLAVLALAVYLGLEAYRQAEVRRAETLAESVFTARADGVPYALANLRPLGALAVPRLRKQRVDEQADRVQRLHAAYALADLGEAPREFLLDQISTAPVGECRNLVTALAQAKEAALPELARRAESAAENAANARYAIVALHLGDAQPAMDALAIRGDPIHRTTLIHAYAPWHGELGAAAELLHGKDDAAFRSGLCAAFGTITPDTLEPVERDQAAKALLKLYVEAPDGATHSAAGWALRQWKQDLPVIEPTSRSPSGRRWFVNGQRMTMVEVPTGRFTMGTAGDGNANQVTAQEVTLTSPPTATGCRPKPNGSTPGATRTSFLNTLGSS